MKDDLLKARVSKSQKEGIQRIAAARGEAEAVIIREALAQYIERHDATSVELKESAPTVKLPAAKPVKYSNPKRKAS